MFVFSVFAFGSFLSCTIFASLCSVVFPAVQETMLFLFTIFALFFIVYSFYRIPRIVFSKLYVFAIVLSALPPFVFSRFATVLFSFFLREGLQKQ